MCIQKGGTPALLSFFEKERHPKQQMKTYAPQREFVPFLCIRVLILVSSHDINADMSLTHFFGITGIGWT
jgi:hypothetical protein